MSRQSKIPFCITSDYDSIRDDKVFFSLLNVLMAFSYKLIGDSTLRLSKNKLELAYDLSMDAIKTHLENPDIFDPKRNPDLVKYLKYYQLKRLIYNHKNLKGQQNEVFYEKDDSIGGIVDSTVSYEIDLIDSIDLSNYIQLINARISDDEKLKQLFELRYIKDYSRKEVIKELNISQGEYNNRIRRLDTIRNRVIKLQHE